MTRGTFANIRIRNLLAPGTEGGVTRHLPDGAVMSIYDAAMKYQQEHVPLVVLAGAEYGTGSSRDWAAKGTLLLGVRAVIAVSFERIHRSNLVGMGVLPLRVPRRADLAIARPDRRRDVRHPRPRRQLAAAQQGRRSGPRRPTAARRSSPPPCGSTRRSSCDYYRNGGILQTVLRKLRGKLKRDRRRELAAALALRVASDAAK